MDTVSILVQYGLAFLFGFIGGCAWVGSRNTSINARMDCDSKSNS